MDNTRLNEIAVEVFKNLIEEGGDGSFSVIYNDNDLYVELYHDDQRMFHEARLEPNAELEDLNEEELKDMLETLYTAIHGKIIDRDREIRLEAQLDEIDAGPSF